MDFDSFKQPIMDAHMHFWEWSLFQLFPEVTFCRNLEEVGEKMKAHTLECGWLVGRGIYEDLIAEKVMPDEAVLNELFGYRPAIVVRICLHVLSMNRAAMDRLGCYAPMGMFYENDVLAILSKVAETMGIPAHEVTDRGRRILSDKGISRVIDMGMTGTNLERVGEAYFYTIEPELLDREGALGLKIFADGTLGSRTAALSRPYGDQPRNYGRLNHSDADLAAMIELAHNRNKPVAIHAVGDRAVSQVLKVLKLDRHRLDRLEHVNYCPEELLDEIADMVLPICIQPVFALDDYNALRRRLGGHRIGQVYPWQQMRERGIYLMAGSDAPVTPVDWDAGIKACAVSANPNQCLGSDYIMDLYTKRNWEFYNWQPL